MAGYSSDEDELLDLNRRTFAAEDAHDPEPLRGILADDFVIVRARLRADGGERTDEISVRPGAIQTRSQMLEQVAKETRSFSRHRHEVCVHVDGDGGVVACRLELREAGEPAGQFWNTQVYTRRGGEWRCVDWRVAPMP